jgi:trk system potassium uptake protein TrkA
VILKYVRGGRVVSVFELPESEAEALEVIVQQETPAEGRSIEGLGLPPEALVGAVVRGDQTLTPDPDRVLAVGDHVILLALPRAIPALERAFGL